MKNDILKFILERASSFEQKQSYSCEFVEQFLSVGIWFPNPTQLEGKRSSCLFTHFTHISFFRSRSLSWRGTGNVNYTVKNNLKNLSYSTGAII
jgi:hypothetical protein